LNNVGLGLRVEFVNKRISLIAYGCDRGCLAPCDLTAGRGCYKSRYEKQKKFYSGKQKNHTFKNQFIVTPNGQGRVDVVVGKPGPTSDLNTWRSSKKKILSS
jgi:hypothetical protein